MIQKMDAKHVYDLDDLKKFKESGASVEEVRKAYAMMAENKERREKATEELVNLGWKEFLLGRVKDLVEQGADVNAKDKNGNTPLHRVSMYGDIDIVEYLVEQGTNVNAKDKNGNTPLHWASVGGHTGVVKYLVEHGADVMAKSKDGNTPLHEAKHYEYTGVKKYLEEMEKLSLQRSKKAKEIRSNDADRAGQSVDHSLRRQLFGGNQLRRNAPLSPAVAARLKKTR